MSHGPAAIVDQGVLHGQPIRAISYLEPGHSWDSGFAIFSDTPGADEGDTAVVCLDCALDEWPVIGRGLDVARRHGEAIRNGDGWTTRVIAANG
jgi:hypothetical protein